MQVPKKMFDIVLRHLSNSSMLDQMVNDGSDGTKKYRDQRKFHFQLRKASGIEERTLAGVEATPPEKDQPSNPSDLVKIS